MNNETETIESLRQQLSTANEQIDILTEQAHDDAFAEILSGIENFLVLGLTLAEVQIALDEALQIIVDDLDDEEIDSEEAAA